ncbi:hypothetical protein GOBAR_DD04957 [Gossypium barbadense]|nr:hypothetical protein GOBAR_DD04957 [Gossypium barbadense]
MGKTEQNSVLLVPIFFFLLTISLPVSVYAKKPVAIPRKEDIPYIKCQVCEKIASQLVQQVQSKQTQISPKKISEYQIIEIAENVCNLKKEEADWILKIDIVEQGDKLEKSAKYRPYLSMPYNLIVSNPSMVMLVEQNAEGICNTECKTIERTCQEGMPGAPNMQMYSREELMNMKNFGGDADDDEDEDEDQFPSNLEKVLKDKESKQTDWKQKIIKGVKDAGETLKRHATKVSFRVQKWWKGFKAAQSKSGKTEL